MALCGESGPGLRGACHRAGGGRAAKVPGESIAAIFATAGTSFVYADLGQFRQQRLELLPDPAAEVFAGGILQAGYIVQIVVVELLVDRLEDLSLIHISEPTRPY